MMQCLRFALLQGQAGRGAATATADPPEVPQRAPSGQAAAAVSCHHLWTAWAAKHQTHHASWGYQEAQSLSRLICNLMEDGEGSDVERKQLANRALQLRQADGLQDQ